MIASLVARQNDLMSQIADAVVDAPRGWIAHRAGGTVAFAHRGISRIIVTDIGKDEFLVTWEVGPLEWSNVRVERAAVAMIAYNLVDKLATEVAA